MPTGPKGQKRPAVLIGNAVHVMRLATGEIEKKAPQRRTKKERAADLATVDADERVLLITRKVQEARTARPRSATVGSWGRSSLMADQTERAARLLVRALFYATDGERRWWVLPANLNDPTKEAIVMAVDRGWMLDRGAIAVRLAFKLPDQLPPGLG